MKKLLENDKSIFRDWVKDKQFTKCMLISALAYTMFTLAHTSMVENRAE